MSKRNGSWSPLRSASWSARGLCFILCIVLLLLPSLSYANSPNKRLLSIEYKLSRIIGYSNQLEEELKNSQNLTKQKQQIINEQLIELADLKVELKSWKASDEQKAKRIAELLIIIDELEKRLQELSESCENIVQPLKEALTIAEKEIRRQKIKTVVYVILAAAAAGAAGYGIGKAGK